jgi:hypothetical protein
MVTPDDPAVKARLESMAALPSLQSSRAFWVFLNRAPPQYESCSDTRHNPGEATS